MPQPHSAPPARCYPHALRLSACARELAYVKPTGAMGRGLVWARVGPVHSISTACCAGRWVRGVPRVPITVLTRAVLGTK